MDLLQLKYFKVVAEQEHITKSAKLLMVSQPYLSAIPGWKKKWAGSFLTATDVT
ncbi:hypothetical protein [Phascolarctobacterium faecium]|uniref:hypothetical protein n=1 Tax=Phascolarctobacterium faecium TaxID=33025 RepID=UPI00242DF8FA|nr:hypothetical protein [Phascolarctobacterium faecium]